MSHDTPLITHPADGRWIIVSEKMPHRIVIYDNGNLVYTIRHFSLGRAGHGPPTGKFTVFNRDLHHVSSLYKAHGHPAPMPFAVFFAPAVAFHQGSPTTPSHGCIHLEKTDAEWVFNWSDPKKGKVHVWVLVRAYVD